METNDQQPSASKLQHVPVACVKNVMGAISDDQREFYSELQKRIIGVVPLEQENPSWRVPQ